MTTRIKHLYIHVPFCKTICSYCDFCHRVYDSNLVKQYLDRLRKDISNLEYKDFMSIYIGGGTPSSLSDFELEELLKMIEPLSKKVLEYTIEINPETITIDKVKLLRKYHVNRVSIGLQSSNIDELKLMNRHHTFDDVKNSVNLLKSNGINNISIDIIYSLPNQTMDSLKKTLDDAISLNNPHLSIYSLTIEENTVFGKKNYQHLDDDTEADMYEYIVNRLQEAGYKQYEIANFAKEGYESKHNVGYWEYNDFIGLGPGSSSKIGNKRYDISRDLNRYFNDVNPIENTYELSDKDLMFENIMMSLRMEKGLDLLKFKERYKLDALDVYQEAIEKNKNNLIIENNRLKVIDREILNTILVDFM